MLSYRMQGVLSLMYSEALLNPADLGDISYILTTQDVGGVSYSFGQLWSMGKDRVSQIRQELSK